MFTQTDYFGETFKGTQYSHSALRDAEFKDCTFVGVNFSETLFQRCRFAGCSFEDCDLSLMQVSGSSFRGVAFRKSRVIGIDWTAAAWEKRSARQLLPSINFYDCILNYSRFFGLGLEQIHIHNCIAHEVDFSEADLRKADLRKTDFENSLFKATRLEEANLSDAKNYFISPTLNTITKAIFTLPEALALLYSMDIVIGDAYPER